MRSVIREQSLDKLCFSAWRLGYKFPKIMENAQGMYSDVTEQELKAAFRNMFDRELSENPQYLRRY